VKQFVRKLFGREPRSPDDIAVRERELAEAQRIRDEQATDRAFARVGPRNAIPQERERNP